MFVVVGVIAFAVSQALLSELEAQAVAKLTVWDSHMVQGLGGSHRHELLTGCDSNTYIGQCLLHISSDFRVCLLIRFRVFPIGFGAASCMLHARG